MVPSVCELYAGPNSPCNQGEFTGSQLQIASGLDIHSSISDILRTLLRFSGTALVEPNKPSYLYPGVTFMWIKICGITNCDDAATVVDTQADAIGLNFYPKSKRYVAAETARRIADMVQRRVELVGVFVNAPLTDITQLVEDVGLTAVQFHGDEQPNDIQQFQELCPTIPVIRAFRVGPETAGFAEQIQKYNDLLPPLNAALADAWSADEYGGTGQTVSSRLLDGHQHLTSRLILAGGLTAANVSEAINAIHPWGVDTASGVESTPGIKSADLVRSFVTACRNTVPNDPPCQMV